MTADSAAADDAAEAQEEEDPDEEDIVLTDVETVEAADDPGHDVKIGFFTSFIHGLHQFIIYYVGTRNYGDDAHRDANEEEEVRRSAVPVGPEGSGCGNCKGKCKIRVILC